MVRVADIKRLSMTITSTTYTTVICIICMAIMLMSTQSLNQVVTNQSARRIILAQLTSPPTSMVLIADIALSRTGIMWITLSRNIYIGRAAITATIMDCYR